MSFTFSDLYLLSKSPRVIMFLPLRAAEKHKLIIFISVTFDPDFDVPDLHKQRFARRTSLLKEQA